MVTLSGDSAGTNLPAVAALKARDHGNFEISAQGLVYPVIDYRGGTQSFKKFEEGYGSLEADTVSWFMERYLPEPALRDDWRACPINATSHRDLPLALVISAQCDVLCDEGAEYARQMKACRVEVQYVEFKGMTPGFFGFLSLVEDVARAHETVAAFLQRVWK